MTDMSQSDWDAMSDEDRQAVLKAKGDEQLEKVLADARKDEVVEQQMQLPPQVKFGIAIMELEDGSVIRMPISPSGDNITYGQMMRMLMGELEDMRAEMMALKALKLMGRQPPQQPGGGGSLVDRA